MTQNVQHMELKSFALFTTKVKTSVLKTCRPSIKLLISKLIQDKNNIGGRQCTARLRASGLKGHWSKVSQEITIFNIKMQNSIN